MNLLITQALLRQAGLVAETAYNGSEAVRLASENRYDLILMEVQMPEVNGLDDTQLIRSGPCNSSTTIIATSANAFIEDRQRCMQAGMNDFLPKPVDAEALFSTLHGWLLRA